MKKAINRKKETNQKTKQRTNNNLGEAVKALTLTLTSIHVKLLNYVELYKDGNQEKRDTNNAKKKEAIYWQKR